MRGDEQDPRRPLKIVVEVLATEAQALALQEAIGEAICAAPGNHPGPCRVAWTTAVNTELSAAEEDFIWEVLGDVPTWLPDEVDRSLDLPNAEDRPPRPDSADAALLRDP